MSVAVQEPSSFWQRRIVAPLSAQLRQGITPEKLALTVALGLVLGMFPIMGATTALCAVVAWRLRLNQPVIQLVNYMSYPVHLLCLLPFYRAGETLFGQPHVPIFSVSELVARFKAGPLQFFADYGMVGLYGVVVWCLVAPFLITAIYFIARGPLRAMNGRSGRMAAAQDSPD